MEEVRSTTARDALGIAGWDRVDKLAEALVATSGLGITDQQAVRIRELYSELLPYDKKPITFRQRLMRPSRGRFARSKNRSGHVSVEAVKRSVLAVIFILSYHPSSLLIAAPADGYSDCLHKLSTCNLLLQLMCVEPDLTTCLTF